jgi:hypothetical protein
LDDEQNQAADEENMVAYPHRPPVPLENVRVVGVEHAVPLVREPSGKLVRSQSGGDLVAATVMARWLLEVRQERGGVARTNIGVLP